MLAVPAVVAALAVVSFAFGLAVSFSTSRWIRYWVACAIVRRRRLLPRRPAEFLDWGYTAGLFRLAGLGTQFRHREFQEWLERGSPS